MQFWLCFIPKVYLWPTIYYAGCVSVFTAQFVLREKNNNHTTTSWRSEKNLNHYDSSVPPALCCGNATQCWLHSTQHGQRSDDPNPLESVVMQHSSDLDHIKAQPSGLQRTLRKFLVCSCFLLFKIILKNILMLSHLELHNRIQFTQTATTGNTVLCKTDFYLNICNSCLLIVSIALHMQ